MKFAMYVELNIVALTILLLIFLNIHKEAEKYLVEQKIFLALLSFNALTLILDTIMLFLDGQPGLFIRPLYLFVTIVYFILNPVMSMTWSFYADYQIFQDKKRLKRLLIPMLLPIVLNTTLSILSIFGSFTFYLDQNNFYHRGQFFYLMAALSYIYLLYTFIFIIANKKKIQKKKFLPIFIFALPPFIGGILQSAFYGIPLIWVSMTISILIIFINLQNDQLFTDYLTGLFNRSQLDFYLANQVANIPNHTLLAGIMIDLDSFKMINDVYGHCVGDEALIDTANLLKRTFTKNAFIARYGGDEFVIILGVKESQNLDLAVERLNKNIKEFNAKTKTSYRINLSLGIAYFDPEAKMSVHEFLNNIDYLMYQDKRKKQLSLV